MLFRSEATAKLFNSVAETLQANTRWAITENADTLKVIIKDPAVVDSLRRSLTSIDTVNQMKLESTAHLNRVLDDAHPGTAVKFDNVDSTRPGAASNIVLLVPRPTSITVQGKVVVDNNDLIQVSEVPAILVELKDKAIKQAQTANRNRAIPQDRKSTRLNSSHVSESRMPSSA